MYMKEYQRWLAEDLQDPELKPELEAIKHDEKQIKEQFGANLQFGTAGMRGILGAGCNRMNIYTVRRATQGFANYLAKDSAKVSVALAYDSRIKSTLFAKEAARVLAASGVQVYLYPELKPAPMLSFAVRKLKATAGIMITASHNPAEYNGFKAYGDDGCQLSTKHSGGVTKEVEKLDVFNDVKLMDYDDAIEKGLIELIGDDVSLAYYDAVINESIRPEVGKDTGVKIVYSPLHGTGNVPVRHVLQAMGYKEVSIVAEQEKPDGNFPTAPYPNPEVRQSLELGIKLAEEKDADLVLATDPDADRVGIAVKDDSGDYKLLTGNEVGVMLLHYIAQGRKATGTLPQNPVAIRSLVSTPMVDAVAKDFGIEMVEVLTGFKYVGEYILKLEKQKEQDRFLFAFEESYGYLIGTYVRDKDAVVASLLICEMAAWCKEQGSSLYGMLQNLYKTYGFYHNTVDSFAFAGIAGMKKMTDIMQALRSSPPKDVAAKQVVKIADFETKKKIDLLSGTTTDIDLPQSNVLCYTLEDGSVIIVRPSGTEPKIKVYYTTKGDTKAKAEATQKKLAGIMKTMIV